VILGVLSNADALFLAAAVPVIGGIGYNIWQNHQARAAADLLAAEFKPNGGSSTKDALNRLEKAVGALHVGQDSLRAGQADLRQRIVAVEDYVTKPKPTH
tara:strand:+ start:234 stop:533 length:300 start_codon:yes stop_codon:yes gene_type:complete